MGHMDPTSGYSRTFYNRENRVSLHAFYTLSASTYCSHLFISEYRDVSFNCQYEPRMDWLLLLSMPTANSKVFLHCLVQCVKELWFPQSRIYLLISLHLKTRPLPRLTVLLVLKYKATLGKKSMHYKLLNYVLMRNSSLGNIGKIIG